MAELITIRTATRGRAPQAFTYQGLGKVTDTRELETKGGDKFQIDELDTTGVFEGLDEAIEFTGLNSEETVQAIVDFYNHKQREAASPAAGTAPHALDNLVAFMVEKGIVANDEKELTTWKRRMSNAYQVVFSDAVEGTSKAAMILWTGLRDKAGRAALKAGYVPELEKPEVED